MRGDSKAEEKYHALKLPAELPRLQQASSFYDSPAAAGTIKFIFTKIQLQVQLHIGIPSHLSNIGLNSQTKARQASTKGVHALLSFPDVVRNGKSYEN